MPASFIRHCRQTTRGGCVLPRFGERFCPRYGVGAVASASFLAPLLLRCDGVHLSSSCCIFCISLLSWDWSISPLLFSGGVFVWRFQIVDGYECALMMVWMSGIRFVPQQPTGWHEKTGLWRETAGLCGSMKRSHLWRQAVGLSDDTVGTGRIRAFVLQVRVCSRGRGESELWCICHRILSTALSEDSNVVEGQRRI